MLDLIIVNFRAPSFILLERLKIMRLSFYSGLAIAVIAADTTKAIKLEDEDEANYLAETKDSEPAEHQGKGWNLSQSMSEGEGSLSTGAESEAGNESEAWATASSGSEGESESGGDSDGDADSDSDVDSEGGSGSDLDSGSDSGDDLAQIDADEWMNLAQTGTEADAEFFSWIKKKAMAAAKLARQKAAQAKRWLMAKLHRQR